MHVQEVKVALVCTCTCMHFVCMSIFVCIYEFYVRTFQACGPLRSLCDGALGGQKTTTG